MTERRQLPLGTVVKVNDLDSDLMIIGQFPVVEKDGKKGYFDYIATYLPLGAVTNDNAFFNKEDIEKVIFIGYIDSQFQQLDANYESLVDAIEYSKFQIKDFK